MDYHEIHDFSSRGALKGFGVCKDYMRFWACRPWNRQSTDFHEVCSNCMRNHNNRDFIQLCENGDIARNGASRAFEFASIMYVLEHADGEVVKSIFYVNAPILCQFLRMSWTAMKIRENCRFPSLPRSPVRKPTYLLSFLMDLWHSRGLESCSAWQPQKSESILFHACWS